jgi:hypothetical protein
VMAHDDVCNAEPAILADPAGCDHASK